MENPCKIVCYGDSLTAGYVPAFEKEFAEKYPEVDIEVVNAGVGGETSRDGLKRLSYLAEERPQLVLLGFGMNDQEKGVSTVEFARNLSEMVSAYEEVGARVLLLTLNPVRGGTGSSGNGRIDAYNYVIRDVAHERRIRVVDISSSWKRDLSPWEKGLADYVHPNSLGYGIYSKELLRTVPRQSVIILWQYNGNPSECNYACPYCTYDPRTQKGHFFTRDITSWRRAFRYQFGNQRIVFYLAHGEPMAGERFYDVLDMIGDEADWRVRITSNISFPLGRLMQTRVAKEGRLDVNASFHPTQTSIDSFLKQALFLRENGIEPSVVYVMWPAFFGRLEKDFGVFSRNNLLLHLRHFQGAYRGKVYPRAYSEEERLVMARYMDDAMIKHMVSREPSFGRLTWSGVDFIIVDNEGNVGYCDDSRPDRYCLGSVFEDDLRLLSVPQPFPVEGVSDGTVDGVANFLDLDYRQLDEGNNVISFSRQGGVYHTKDGLHYGNMHTDFSDPRVRAEYRFPPRCLLDCYHILRYKERDWNLRWRQIEDFMVPKAVVNWRSTLGRHLPTLHRTYRYLKRL